MPRTPPAPQAVPRLAANQLRRMRRIVDAAVRLAERGGFDGVRLRDVADRSDVALGTLYKYFHSKEDILLFALNEEFERFEASLRSRPLRGRDALARIRDFFERATRGLVAKPHFARAVLRSMATGSSGTTLKIASVQLRITRLLVAALRGETPSGEAGGSARGASARERAVAGALQHVWFSALVTWSVGLLGEAEVSRQVTSAARLMLAADRNGRDAAAARLPSSLVPRKRR